MIKILIGGSPCTFWSIAQKNNRETTAEGMGWELFKNYLIAKEKFKPDFFLYENNKSAAEEIKAQIRQELGVTNGAAHYIEINSALLSAQNRKRFYVHNCGDIQQPHDRGLLLRDVLEDKNLPHSPEYISDLQRVGTLPSEKGVLKDNQATRVYSIFGKSSTLSANGGGWGAKTGLYAIPIAPLSSQKARCLIAGYSNKGVLHIIESNNSNNPHKQQWDSVAERVDEIKKSQKNCYEVKNGAFTAHGKEYPIKLPDGFYVIRKLTVTECCRLQTLPDNYCRAVSDTQAYKGLGNGWTAEVIIHILNGALKDIPKDEEIVVLSMYDGIGTGRYCLDKMGFTNVKYFAYEIDKYAMQVAQSNFPDIIQRGDAFAVREKNWHL